MNGLENLSERDLIIQQGRDIKNLCKAFEDFKDDNAMGHKLIFQKLDELTEKKVSNRLFFFAMGLIITFIVGLTAYTGTIKNEVVKNTTCIERIDKRGG